MVICLEGGADDFNLLVIFNINLIFLAFAFSALTLLVGCQEEHPACKKLNDEVGAGTVICLD